MRVLVSIVLLAFVFLPGCGGGGASMKSDLTTVSKGQELLDLKKALDAGAISPAEYEKQRKKILDRD